MHYHTACLRWGAATSLVVTAAVHVALVPAHLREAPYAGGLFIALSATALILAISLLGRGPELAWTGAGLVSITALLAYVASRSVGLPLLHDDVGDWLNPLGIAALASELATALICLRRHAANTAGRELARSRSSYAMSAARHTP